MNMLNDVILVGKIQTIYNPSKDGVLVDVLVCSEHFDRELKVMKGVTTIIPVWLNTPAPSSFKEGDVIEVISSMKDSVPFNAKSFQVYPTSKKIGGLTLRKS